MVSVITEDRTGTGLWTSESGLFFVVKGYPMHYRMLSHILELPPPQDTYSDVPSSWPTKFSPNIAWEHSEQRTHRNHLLHGWVDEVVKMEAGMKGKGEAGAESQG